MELLLYGFVIKYIPGSSNIIPDALSHRPDYDNNTSPTQSLPLLPESRFDNLHTILQNPFDNKIHEDVKLSKKYQSFI